MNLSQLKCWIVWDFALNYPDTIRILSTNYPTLVIESHSYGFFQAPENVEGKDLGSKFCPSTVFASLNVGERAEQC